MLRKDEENDDEKLLFPLQLASVLGSCSASESGDRPRLSADAEVPL